MANAPVDELTLLEAARRVREGEVSSRELTEALLSRIAALNPKVNAYITVLPERALEQARACDGERVRGSIRGVLHGVPLGLKDIFCTRGVRTTYGSRILHNFDPPYDATVTEVVLSARRGRCWGSTTWTSSPWGRQRRIRATRSPTTPGI